MCSWTWWCSCLSTDEEVGLVGTPSFFGLSGVWLGAFWELGGCFPKFSAVFRLEENSCSNQRTTWAMARAWSCSLLRCLRWCGDEVWPITTGGSFRSCRCSMSSCDFGLACWKRGSSVQRWWLSSWYLTAPDKSWERDLWWPLDRHEGW